MVKSRQGVVRTLENGLVSIVLGVAMVFSPGESYAVERQPVSIERVEQFSWRNAPYGDEKKIGDWTVHDEESQLGCNVCTGKATNSVIASEMKKASGDLNYNPKLSPQQYLCEEVITNCEDGGYSAGALRHAQEFGIVDEDCLPYTGNENDCNYCPDKENRRTKIHSWDYIDYLDQEGWVTLSPQGIFELAGSSIEQYGLLLTNIRMPPAPDSDGISRCNDDLSGTKHEGNLTGYYFVYDGDEMVLDKSYFEFKLNVPGFQDEGHLKVGLDWSNGYTHGQCKLFSLPPKFLIFNKPLSCGLENLSLCETTTDCNNAGGYWWNDNCNSGVEPDYIGDAIRCLQISSGMKVDKVPQDVTGDGIRDAIYNLQKASGLR